MSVTIEFASTIGDEISVIGNVVFDSYGDSESGVTYGRIRIFEETNKGRIKISDTGLFDLETHRRAELVEGGFVKK